MLKGLISAVKRFAHRRSVFGKALQIDRRRVAVNEALIHHNFKVAERAVKAGHEKQAARARYRAHRAQARRDWWRSKEAKDYARHHFWGKKLRNRLTRIKRWRQTHDTFQPYMANGCPYAGLSDALKAVIARGYHRGLYCTATTNGTHAPGSYHYSWRAVDEAGDMGRMIDFQRAEAGHPPNTELFGPDGFYIKDGTRYPGHFPGHGDHVHKAI